MILIAESRSSLTKWVIVAGTKVVETAYTSGLNPYIKTRREISHAIRLELPESFFHSRYEMIYFYGAGCENPDKNKIVEASLIAQFKSPAHVENDLLGAARAMLNHKTGMVCIISMGTNSCLFDGQNITYHIPSGGYILGDEGSSAYMGRWLVADVVKSIAPQEVIDTFFSTYKISVEEIMDQVYLRGSSQFLANYADFLFEHIKMPYCADIVYRAFLIFMRRNISRYPDYQQYPLHVMGDTACAFSEQLLRAAADFGIKIAKIEESSIEGLVKYHTEDAVMQP